MGRERNTIWRLVSGRREKGKMHFREATTKTKPYHKMMDTVEGYLKKIAAAATNNGKLYWLLADNMSNIVTSNATLTSTVATTKK